DWSSDVCSSDLVLLESLPHCLPWTELPVLGPGEVRVPELLVPRLRQHGTFDPLLRGDRAAISVLLCLPVSRVREPRLTYPATDDDGPQAALRHSVVRRVEHAHHDLIAASLDGRREG